MRDSWPWPAYDSWPAYVEQYGLTEEQWALYNIGMADARMRLYAPGPGLLGYKRLMLALEALRLNPSPETETAVRDALANYEDETPEPRPSRFRWLRRLR